MSTAPAPYERQTSFYSYEATYPTLPKSGASLDAEFNAVRSSLNATQDRLAEIQRDDGLLANASVHPQSITPETYVLLGSDYVPKGSWLTATTYEPGDLVEHLGLNYLAILEHVSNDFDVDLANGDWQAFGGYPTAAQVVFAPGGTVGGLSVQEAILELDGDIQARQPIDDNLTMLASLTPAADRLPYFDSANTMAQATFTAAGRAVVAAADVPAQQVALDLIPGVSAGNLMKLDGAAKAPPVDGSQLTNIVVPDDSITADKLADTLNLSGKTITMPPANTPVFTKSFESTQQTITSAGALTLPHSLVVKPKLVQLALVCQTAEFNYSIGDEIIVPTGLAQESTNNRGIGVLIDATNITIRFGSAASVMTIQNKTTGNTAVITNANWKLVVRAWA